jgi:beta-phosphoglucomutase-like phosphatase (HAD superfamily)
MFQLSRGILENSTAIISDMDGLIIDSESWTFNAWIQACKDVGYELPHEVAFSGVGRGREPFKKMLVSYFGDGFDVEAATRSRIRIGNEMLERDGMELRPGGKEFLRAIVSANLPFGIATSTFKEDALTRITRAGIDPSIFHAITFGDEVSRLKPDPEIYLNVAKKLNVNPEDVLAFEDSLSGVNAAMAAGMRVVCIPDMEVYTPPIHPKVIVKKSLFECLTQN